MHVVMLNRYGRLGASSRVRTLQYIPQLSARGISAEPLPLLPDEYLRGKYAGQKRALVAAQSYLRRIGWFLTRAQRADLLWVEKELFPFLPFSLEALLLPRGVPMVVDFDDAIFHNYDQHNSPFVRWLLGDKIDRLMRRADAVIAGNDYLAERARRAGARQVIIVPSVVDMTVYDLDRAGRPTDDGLTIGWIGSPSTYQSFIVPMLPMLRRVMARHGARLMLVGAGPDAAPAPGIEVYPWSEESEQDMLHRMSVGIMPLASTPWAMGKCGYKLIQYMAARVPVVASPVGVNGQIVRGGENGYLASTETEWENALAQLLSDPIRRVRMAEVGHGIATAEYSLQRWAPELVDFLASFIKNKNMN